LNVSLVELDGLYEGARAEEPAEHALLRLAPERLRPHRIVDQGADRGAVSGEVERIVEQHSRLAVDDLVLDAPDPTGHDGRAFHIASATVSPKPSARLFCTTTAARRCT
jgi:hypothetical protein